MQQRWLCKRGHDEHIHRVVTRIPRIANPLCDVEPAIDLHRARVATLHLRPVPGRRIALNDDAAHTSLPEIDSQCESNRTRPDDENLCFCHVFAFICHPFSCITCRIPSITRCNCSHENTVRQVLRDGHGFGGQRIQSPPADNEENRFWKAYVRSNGPWISCLALSKHHRWAYRRSRLLYH
ncbi:hypothetical protein D9M72_491430 [compost metagenome]